MDDQRGIYEAMSRDELIARLKVAEDTLVLIGWSSTMLGHPDLESSERAKAAEQMWQTWCSMIGGSRTAILDPERRRDLVLMTPVLAATRDLIRRDTLAKFGLKQIEEQ